ncbi:uncharacterized protein CBL_13364 [Carabus blaptoides fortunei]
MNTRVAIWRIGTLYITAMFVRAACTAAQENLVRDGALYATEYYTPMDLLSPYNPYYQASQDERMFRESGDEYARPDEAAYQQYAVQYPERFGNRALDKAMLEFLEDNNTPKDDSTDGIKKRMLSSFRERMEREKSKEQQDKLADMFLQKLQQDVLEDPDAEADIEDAFHRDADRERNYVENRDYMEMIEELWEKYKSTHHNRERESSPATSSGYMTAKRQIPIDYTTLGWSGIGFRKRSSMDTADEPDVNNQNDALYFLNYPPAHKEYITNDNSRVRSRYRWLKPTDFDNHLQSAYNPDYLYAQSKRFPVAKRSSNFYAPGGTIVHHKRATNGREQVYKKAMRNDSVSGTDPKVVKDLSNLFGNKGLSMEKTSASLPIKTKKALDKNSKKVSKKNTTNVVHADGHTSQEKTTAEPKRKQVEQVSQNQANDEPLNIRKKSIDWSNYFGIDRRKKKSESYGNGGAINNDWMIKRYNQAVAMAVKRSSGSEYPLNFFRDNYASEGGSYGNEVEQSKRKSQFRNSDASNLDEMDDKLKNIEDLIIDEALKYTGAHEGETDPKEIQEVKDKVISRLAAAYSLEKMRRALSEFKTSLAVQRHAIKAKGGEEDVQEMDAKNTQLEKSKRPDMESKSSSNEFNSIGATECNAVIERRCRSGVAGELSSVFFSLCKWHQMCYVCSSSNNNQESLTNCDVMFLSKADALCHGDVVCQWTARPVVEYLRNVHENIPVELGARCRNFVCAADGSNDIDPAGSDVNNMELPVFTESSAITLQPQIGGDFPGTRRPIPVSTIDWRTTHLSQFTPIQGLDFLIGAEQVHIQQTVELNDLLASVESENRYTVKVPQGETLYLASEASTSFHRLCFGSRRAFTMRLYDQTRQEAIHFVRKLAFTNCLCGCYLQELQIWIPPGELIGVVKQDWTFMVPTFSVQNNQKRTLFKVEGPAMSICSKNEEAYFKIFSPDGTIQMGSIHYQWDQLLVGYNLCLTFPSRNTSSKEKALLLGATFLLEYMYFERVKSSKCLFC